MSLTALARMLTASAEPSLWEEIWTYLVDTYFTIDWHSYRFSHINIGDNGIISIRTSIAALLLGDFIDKLFEGAYLGFSFLLTSFVLVLGEAVNRLRTRKHKRVTTLDALIMGCMQAVAITPGLSRSGSTICGGMFSGLTRKRAADFSFLMSIPAVLGANIISISDAVAEGIEPGMLPGYIVGTIVAAVAGYFAIRLVNILADKNKFGNFAYYCWGIGAAAVVATLIFG